VSEERRRKDLNKGEKMLKEELNTTEENKLQ